MIDTSPAAAPPVTPQAALASLWHEAGLPAPALGHVALPGEGPVVPSSFAVATAAQASLAAAGLAAAELWHARTGQARQQVTVDRVQAVMESSAYSLIDGQAPALWDKLSGLYRCGAAVGEPGWVRIHANFAHHRDGALRLLGCPERPATERAAVQAALQTWRAQDFETAAAEAGLVVAAVRTAAQWATHPQAQVQAAQPVVQLSRIDPGAHVPPPRWPAWHQGQRPLHGLRVLELTRILAGPVAGRTLAAHGADVLLVNGPHLPNIEALPETSRGKRSAHVDLRHEAGRATLRELAQGAHVFLQGYRPGALAGRGFSPQELAALRPGIVVASLSAYGPDGPWAARRGFDSLVQSATGFNDDEARAFAAPEPKALPLQILDYAAGYLLAFGTQAALWHQAHEGGSWLVQVSLAGVGRWLRSLGRVGDGLTVQRPPIEPYLVTEPSGFGALTAVPHAVQLSHTPAGWVRPAMPPGSHPPVWLD